ncbi:MAG: hypothetical protein M3P30_15235 [Chloroflexota bacterium]|nr:hypothetical protein [Chloroflexota bacterium]
MLNFTSFALFELYGARQSEQDDRARRAAWLHKLRDLERWERAASKLRNPLRAARPQAARKLSGADSPWI